MACVGHTASILDRSGAVVCNLDALVDVEWGRALNETATARARVVPQGDCCQCMGGVRTWRHRLVIWRGSVPVFDGPIVLVEWTADGVEVSASDVSAWLAHRLPHTDMSFSDTDLTIIARDVIADAFTPDDPGVSVEIVAPALIFGDRSYSIDVDLSLDHLRDLASTGIDWTVAGSRILLMGTGFCDSIGSLSDTDFPQGLRVVEDGGALATRWVLWAAPDADGTLIKATAGGTDDYYGLLESVHDSQAPQDQGAASILDQTSANAAAADLLSTSVPAPVFIDTGAGPLSPQASIDVASIICGYCLQIASTATCREVAAVQKVVEVRVSESSDGESAQVLCGPTGGA